MKVILEVDSSQNKMPELLRKVFSKRANQIEITCDEQGIVVIDTLFNDDIFFEELVGLLTSIKFKRVLMINSDDPPLKDVLSDGDGSPEDVVPEGNNLEGEDVQEGIVDGQITMEELEEMPGSGVSEEEIVVTEDVHQEEPKVEVHPEEVLVVPQNAGADGENMPPKEGQNPDGKKRRKKAERFEGEKLENLYVIPEFPKELTIENVVAFFAPEKERIKESLTYVITIGMNKELDCDFDWKDMVRAAKEINLHITDYDRLLASKKIKETFEKYGYVLLMKGFLKLLRQYVIGEKKVPKEVVQEVKTVVPEPALEIVPKQENVQVQKQEGRFSCLPYCEELEEMFSEFWNEGLSCEELLIGLFEKMSDENLSSNESAYLEICANAVAFDSLNCMHIDLGVSQIEAKRIQCSLSDKLGSFTDAQGLPEVSLFDFLKDVRTIFDNEA